MFQPEKLGINRLKACVKGFFKAGPSPSLSPVGHLFLYKTSPYRGGRKHSTAQHSPNVPLQHPPDKGGSVRTSAAPGEAVRFGYIAYCIASDREAGSTFAACLHNTHTHTCGPKFLIPSCGVDANFKCHDPDAPSHHRWKIPQRCEHKQIKQK